MKEDEIERIVEKNLSRVPHARGVNNHMGSRFTEWSPGMKSFLKIMKKGTTYPVSSEIDEVTAVYKKDFGFLSDSKYYW